MEKTPLRLKDIMTREVHTVGRNDHLAVADTLMKEARIRHLPAVDEGGAVCAVISQRDLFRGRRRKARGPGDGNRFRAPDRGRTLAVRAARTGSPQAMAGLRAGTLRAVSTRSSAKAPGPWATRYRENQL